jgi:hypothetical protein
VRGALRGELADASLPGARLVCHCDDCQAWARWLGRDDVMDAHGGTEVLQGWPALVRLTHGADQLRLARLSPKGLHRWYAGCCRTPVGNTMGSARVPFVGIPRRFLAATDAELDARFGPKAGIQGKFAPGGCPPGVAPSASPSTILAAAGRLVRGTWIGGSRPTPFFDDEGRTTAVATVLTPEERKALG